MAYAKTTWNNLSSPPINAENLNKIEQGIYNNSLGIDKINPSGTATITDEFASGQIEDVIGFKSFKLKGQTSQGESPTPDSPQDVNNVSGDNVIEISNKNLIEYSFKGYNITSQGKFETGGTSLDLDVHIAKVKAGTTYTITPATNVIAYFDERPTITSQAYNNSREEITNTNRLTPTRSGYIAIRTATSNTAQLEKGTSATSFVAHQGNNFEINLGAIEICKIGTYQDYIFKRDGKWWKHKAIEKTTLNGSETPTLNTALTNTTRALYSNILPYNAKAGVGSGICNLLPYYENWVTDVEGFYLDNNTTNLVLRINKSTVGTTITSVNNFLSENNMTIYYILATPIDEELTYAPLLRQLDELYNSGLYDTTNISQDNSSEAFILDFEACKNNINGIVEYIRR